MDSFDSVRWDYVTRRSWKAPDSANRSAVSQSDTRHRFGELVWRWQSEYGSLAVCLETKYLPCRYLGRGVNNKVKKTRKS